MIFSLVYVSTLTSPLSVDDLRRLLHQCRTANVQQGVTGLLLHRDGTFLHLLEGNEDRVKSLFAKVSADPRHQHVVVVREREQDKRQFPDWSAGFGDVNSQPGRISVLNGGPDPVVQTDTEAEFVTELLTLFDR